MSSFKGAKILHVDDNEITRYTTSKMLTQAGFQVLSAANAKQGLEKLAQDRPSLVLLDVNLPDMSGYELCRRIKGLPDFSATPVLHMSASFVKSEDQVRGLQGGADGYITEPVDPEVLIATIKAALRVRQAELERAAALRATEEAQTRLKILADVGHVLSESLANEKALDQILGALVPRFADAATIVLFDDHGRASTVTSAHSDADRGALLRKALSSYPPALSPGAGSANEGANAKIVAPVTDEWLMSFSRDGEHFIMLRGVGAKEALIAGVDARGKRLGVIALASTSAARTFGAQDIQFIETLAHRMAVVIDNARLLRQAQHHNRMKDEFLASLAHELRNPLGPIRNASELMKSRINDSGAIEHLRHIIEKQVHNIARIVDDLTDVARIEHGKLTLRRDTIDIRGVITQASEACGELVKAKHQVLRLQLPDAPVYVDGDATRLEQVVCNLIQNAAKYTPELGTITVRAEARGEHSFVRVQDNGIGISSQLLPRIFDLFTQAPQPLDRPQGGLGIGLTIVRRLVELHGGSISARSEGEGKGSEFIVRLPLVTPPAAQAPSKAPAAAQGKNENRILLVDDNGDIRETMQMLVEAWGHEIRSASHASEALAILKTWKPSLILLDIGLPDVNGFQLAKQIRAVDEWKNIRMIAVTGYSAESDRRKAMEAGFDGVMTKPVDIDELETVLKK